MAPDSTLVVAAVPVRYSVCFRFGETLPRGSHHHLLFAYNFVSLPRFGLLWGKIRLCCWSAAAQVRGSRRVRLLCGRLGSSLA
jgi:hypothetical protein